MSGHSKWSTIKHKKGALDAKRGKIFTKILKEITIAAKIGGGDISSNPRLRLIVAKAKGENIPKDNIEKAVKRGTGELEGVSYEEITYEGYGPGGAAILIDALTDNKNRTVAEVRNILSKTGGNMGEAGSVAWNFSNKGYFAIDKNSIEEETLMEIAINAGAEDVKNEDDVFEVISEVKDFEKIKESLEKENVKIEEAEITMLPNSYVKIEGKNTEQMIKLMEKLEDSDDVQKIYTNADLPDDMV